MMKNVFFLLIFALVLSIPVSGAQVQSIVYQDDLILDKGSTAITRLNIEVNEDSGLSAVTLTISFDPNIVQLLNVMEGDFDNYTYNINNELGFIRIVSFQTGAAGVGPGLIRYVDIEFKGIGAEGSTSVLSIEVDDFFNNTGILIPYQVNNGTLKINKPIEQISYSGFFIQKRDSGISIQKITEVQKDKEESNNVSNDTLPDNSTYYTTSSIISENNYDEIILIKNESIYGFIVLLSISFILILTLYFTRHRSKKKK